MNLNDPPSSPFLEDRIHDEDRQHDHHQPHLQPFALNHRVASSSSSVSCHTFFDPTQDRTTGFYDHHQLYQLPQHHLEDYNNCYQADEGTSSYETKNNKVESSGLKLTLWKKEGNHGPDTESSKNDNPVNWMSSKMRLMEKMKNCPNRDRVALKITSSNSTAKVEDHQKLQSSTSAETDLSSNSSSYNYNNSPIRVCADCNTTKTPLWRSGPKGPKSLCNACGIRQRKARRAMAAAAAAAAADTNGTTGASSQAPSLKIKVQHKEKNTTKIENATPIKKRKLATTAFTTVSEPQSNGQKKLGFEDFLTSLSKKLAFYRVFPEDEKDAAILLMALSSGLVHG